MKLKYLFLIVIFFQAISISAFGQEYKYHTVEAGETVYSIAKSYNIDEEDIYKYNPDAREGLDISAKLVIPLSEKSVEENAEDSGVSFKTHKVARRETLYSISKEYDVSIDAIKRYNKELYARELRSGEEIRIPQQGMEKAPAAKERRTTTDIQSQITDTREHVVLPKETKYGIARKYGLTVKELEALNPKVETLQPGTMLRVGTKVIDDTVILTNEDFEFYEVKPKETLYGLSDRFEVSQDSLIALNPALQDGLKTGMVLKVPDKGEGQGNLGISETEELNNPDKVEEVEAATTRLDLTNSLSNFNTRDVVLMLPYNLHKIEEDSTKYYEEAILDNRVLRISLDFYSGAKMAVKKAKELGISTRLKVYDTRQNPQEVSRIISTNNFNDVDAVIGPFLQSTTETAAAKLEAKNIPVINPLSNRSMRKFNNLFQSRPTNNALVEAMLQYISKNVGDKNLIIIADGRAAQLKTRLTGMFPGARTVIPSNGNVKESKIKDQLKKGEENWVILESSSVGIISSATSALNRLKREHEINLFTTDRNSSYDDVNISNMDLSRLNFHYPSVDKEYVKESEGFIEAYEEEYGSIPNQYAVRGYDVTLDILLRLGTGEDLYESLEKHKGFTEYNENKFHYIREGESGFYNDAVYIMRINEDLTLSVVNDVQGNL